MDGVTILAENTYRMCDPVFAGISTVVVTLMCIFIIYLSLKVCTKLECCFVSLMCILAFVTVVYNNVSGYNTIRTEYQVTVDSSVSFQEFFEKYEVISADGYVYTVIERETEDATN
jgi:hypothetical protein